MSSGAIKLRLVVINGSLDGAPAKFGSELENKGMPLDFAGAPFGLTFRENVVLIAPVVQSKVTWNNEL